MRIPPAPTLSWKRTAYGYEAEGLYQTFQARRLTGSWVLYGVGNGNPYPGKHYGAPRYIRRESATLTLARVKAEAERRNGNR